MEPRTGQAFGSVEGLDESLPFSSGVLYRCSADPERTLRAVAGRFEELTGVDRAELARDLAWSELIHPEDRRAAWESVSSAMRAGHPFSIEYRLRAPDGSERWVLDQGTCICQPDGAPSALAGTWLDVTLLRRLEEQAARAGAIGRLAAGVAHDINNLQSLIMGCAQLLGRALPADTATREHLGEIIDAARRSATLARHLVAFTRPGTADVTPMDLNQLVLGMERLLRSVLGREITLEFELETALGTISADPGEIEQILLNLVANAKEAMPHGGVVAISTANLAVAEQGKLPQAGGERDVAYVRLRVKDTGPGIAPETLLRVFEPYFSTKQSTGLGLSTVEAIVRRYGGRVEVTSRIDRGTVFDVLLPRSDRLARPAISQVVSRRPRHLSPLVLVAAGNEERCRELTAALARLHLRSLSATSVPAAMELARQHAASIGAVVTGAELGDAGELGRLCPDAVRVLVAAESGPSTADETGRVVVLGRPLVAGALADALRSLRSDLGTT